MLNLDKEEWMKAAACRGVAAKEGFEAFFPEGSRGRGHKLKAEGVPKYCSNCTVTEECLDYAMANKIQEGAWGGLLLEDRKRVRKEQNAEFDELVSDIEPAMKEVFRDLESQMQDL
jgi:WhiB family redox-sensing transcriptional regulator